MSDDQETFMDSAGRALAMLVSLQYRLQNIDEAVRHNTPDICANIKKTGADQFTINIGLPPLDDPTVMKRVILDIREKLASKNVRNDIYEANNSHVLIVNAKMSSPILEDLIELFLTTTMESEQQFISDALGHARRVQAVASQAAREGFDNQPQLLSVVQERIGRTVRAAAKNALDMFDSQDRSPLGQRSFRWQDYGGYSWPTDGDTNKSSPSK